MTEKKNIPDIGFRGHDFGKFDSVRDLVLRAEEALENSCIQFAPKKVLRTCPFPFTEEWALETSRSFSERNIRIAVWGCYINPVHPDEEKQEEELRKVENCLSLARALNTPVVATETGSRNADTWTDKTFSLFLKNTERLLKKAEKEKTVFAIEAVADKDTIDNAERMLRVMETFRHPNLRVLFDAVNIFPIHGVQDILSFYDETVGMLAPYICALHIKDYVWTDSPSGPVKKGDIPAGEGLMPWPELFKIYKKYGCGSVPMLLENFNPQTLKQSIEYVRKSYGA